MRLVFVLRLVWQCTEELCHLPMFRPVQIPYFEGFGEGTQYAAVNSSFSMQLAILDKSVLLLIIYWQFQILKSHFFYMVAAYISETSQPWVSSQTASLG